MNVDLFDRQIQAVRSRVAALQRRADASSPEAKTLVDEAFEDFQATLEELSVAQQELVQQNEELMEARLEVEQEQSRYQDLFDFAPDAYLVTDLDGVIREANRAAADLLGTAQRFIVPKPLVIFVPESDRTAFRTHLNQIVQEDEVGKTHAWELRVKPREGERFDAALTVAVVRDALGKPAGLRWMVRDITERKRTEGEIRKLNAELETRVRQRTEQLRAANELKDELLIREEVARREAEAARQNMAFLAEASVFLASTLDYAATLAAVARLAVPLLADWCMIDILEEDGSLRRMAVVHRDPDKAEFVRTLQEHYLPHRDQRFGVAEVLRTGKTETFLDLPGSVLDIITQNAEHRELLQILGIHSYLIVPLVARGRTLGAITLVAADPGRSFARSDVELAEDLGRRAAAAIDSARLYRSAQEEIAERKRAEEALRRSEERRQFALDAARMGTWDIDGRTRMVTLANGLAEMFGKPEKIVEMPLDAIIERVHPDDRHWIADRIERALREGGDYRAWCRLHLSDGALRWVETHGQAVWNETGEISGLTGVCWDITDRKQAEQQVRFQARLLDVIEQAVIATDMSGTINYWNRHAETLYGWKASEALGRNVMEVTPSTQSMEQAEEIMAWIRTGKSWSGEFLVRRRDGTNFPALATATPIMDEKGQPIGIVGLSIDISDRQAILEALKRNHLHIEALNERLLRSMTEMNHRVKNNLQIIASLIDLQRLGEREMVPTKELDRLAGWVRALATVHEMLTRAPKEGGEALSLSARTMLTELAPLIRQAAGDQRIDFQVEDAPLTPKQASALALVTNELVSNALKHSQGEVEVSFSARDGHAELAVCDNGPGFPEGFDPAKATHVGLELVRHLIQWDIGGEVRYENRSEGGARVTVMVPVHTLRPSTETESAAVATA